MMAQPSDLVNQSLPFSYLGVSVKSNDGNSHSVQVYTDITGEWITGATTWTANWKTTTGRVLTHKLQLSTQATYEEDLHSTGLGLQDETTGEVESEWAGRGSKERAGEEGM